jgi:hypothetical protein
MKKMTKKERVEQYLDDIVNQAGFEVDNLLNTTVYDLIDDAKLEGIGKTTLSSALNDYKKRYGQNKAGKGGVISIKNTKKERVERYLSTLMKQPVFTVEDLMNLTVYDLFGNSELEGIGKTTLSSGISAFKKKYLKIQYDEEPILDPVDQEESEVVETEPEEEVDLAFVEEAFEDVIINTIEKEGKKERSKKKQKVKEIVAPQKPIENKTTKVATKNVNLDSSDLLTIKQMIQQYQSGQSTSVQPDNLELIELKHALKFFGIDFKMILEHYRKNV